MWVKDIAWNSWIQGLSFLPAIEWVNSLITNENLWTIFWETKELVDGVLNATWANSLMMANAWISTALLTWGAWLLSNKVLKDLGLVWDKTLWVKNLTRYALNWAAMLWTYSAWTAAAPYLLAWAWAYFIWKHGWKLWKEVWKRWIWTAWGLTWWLVKWAAKWLWNSTKAGIKWDQKINPVI